MPISEINFNLNNLSCTSTSVGFGADELQIVSELWDTTITAKPELLKQHTSETYKLDAGQSVGSKHLWTYPIPATWGHGIAWPDKMQLKVWIKKVETFLQTTTPPQPAPGPAPAPAPPGNVIISFLGAAISIPVSALQAVGSAIASAPQNVLKLILESTLAEYHDDVNIQGLQTYRGDLFREMFVDPGAGKKQGVGKYGSKFTIDYTLVGA